MYHPGNSSRFLSVFEFAKVNRRFVPFLLLLVVVALLQGCYRVWVSRGYVTPDAQWSSQAGAVGTKILGPDIDIYVRVTRGVLSEREHTNVFWDSGGELAPPLGISLWFGPKQQNFIFDPYETSVLLPNGNKLKAIRIITKWSGLGRSGDWKCESGQTVYFESAPPYLLRRGYCFEYYFNTVTPPLESQFSMQIDGLAQGGNHVSIPEIKFQKGSFGMMGLPSSRENMGE
jgi:hypothetical protein